MSLLKLSSTQSPIPLLYTLLSSQPIRNFSVSFPHKQHYYLHQRVTCRRRRISHVTFGASNEDTQTELNSVNTTIQQKEDEFEGYPDPQDLEYISQIKRNGKVSRLAVWAAGTSEGSQTRHHTHDPRNFDPTEEVLELLKKNRDMLFSEVKLTIMIEDPREVERKRLIGIDDADTPTREELADVLQEVQDGKIPRDRVALQMLAEEMVQWPNLEVEATKKGPRKSLYAKATDTGIDPEVAAKKLNIDWDSAAEIEEQDRNDESEVPSVVGYGALYLVTAFPVIIGISVVLILFYNSLQ